MTADEAVFLLPGGRALVDRQAPSAPNARFDPTTIARVLAAKRAGMRNARAAAAAGIGRRTLHDWLALGRGGDALYAPFAAAFDRAEREAENAQLAAIRAAMADVPPTC